MIPQERPANGHMGTREESRLDFSKPLFHVNRVPASIFF